MKTKNLFNISFFYGKEKVFSVVYDRDTAELSRIKKTLEKKGIKWQYANVYSSRNLNFIEQVYNDFVTKEDVITTKNIQTALQKGEEYFYNFSTKKRELVSDYSATIQTK